MELGPFGLLCLSMLSLMWTPSPGTGEPNGFYQHRVGANCTLATSHSPTPHHHTVGSNCTLPLLPINPCHRSLETFKLREKHLTHEATIVHRAWGQGLGCVSFILELGTSEPVSPPSPEGKFFKCSETSPLILEEE